MEGPPIRFTKKVRRGLALVRTIAVGSFDDNVLSSRHVFGKWTAAQRAEYHLAIAWIEQQAVRAADEFPAAAKGGAS